MRTAPPEEKIFIVSEGVFSMEGDIADLRGIMKLAKPYGARTYVDEAQRHWSAGGRLARARRNTWECWTMWIS